ncbi:MAG: autotransporter domain-containing protein, partial [Sphingomonadales bacterium]|nr:autotransporter domain-containing protein [Sphingomonadales bacterium]
MRHFLLASTCCFALAGVASAETSITDKRTSAVRTSTVKAGAADDIKITSTGSVELTTGGGAVTLDTNNKVTNEGTIAVSNANNAAGILALAGTSGGIVSSGKITVDETYAATDTDNDGDIDGPFAVGSDRYGIITAGAYSGDVTVTSAGTISVEGNDSYGIKLTGPLTGALRHDGTTTVLGDRAIGIETGNVSGNVRLAGSVTAQGVNAIGAAFNGNIGGTLTIQGTIIGTGYRYATPPSDVSKLDADDLLQGGPGVVIGGNVAGGIILAVPPKDASSTDNDEDKDGIEDSKEGSAIVRSYGAAPAMRIASATQDITIGAVPGTGSGYGLIIDGGIAGNGLYSGIASRGLEVGGMGRSVDIVGGIGIAGTVSATANGASATALRLSDGASTPVIQVGSTGKIEASGGNAIGNIATGILVSDGAVLPGIRNAGSIKATAGGENGTAAAILDLSGTVSLVENSGAISATGAKADSGRNVAIDISENTTGAIIRQTAVAAGVTAPSIT